MEKPPAAARKGIKQRIVLFDAPATARLKPCPDELPAAARKVATPPIVFLLWLAFREQETAPIRLAPVLQEPPAAARMKTKARFLFEMKLSG